MHLELSVLFAVLLFFFHSLLFFYFHSIYIMIINFPSSFINYQFWALLTRKKRKSGAGVDPWSRRCRHFLILLMYQSITYAIYATNYIKEALKQPQQNLWNVQSNFKIFQRWPRLRTIDQMEKKMTKNKS